MTVNIRRFTRQSARVPAVIVLPGFYLDATTIDVSESGALIEIVDVRLVPRNADCVLRLLSDSGRQLVELPVRIVRTAGNRRLGMQTRGISAGALGVLRSLIDSAARGEKRYGRDICALLRRVEGAPPYAVHADAARSKEPARQSA